MATLSQEGAVTADQRVLENKVMAASPGAIPIRLPRKNCRNPRCDAPATRLKITKGAIGTTRKTATATVPRLDSRLLSCATREPLNRSIASF